jgi:hypothetical protein
MADRSGDHDRSGRHRAFVAILVGIALSLGFVLLITASLTCAIALVGWTVRSTWRTRPDRPNA